MIIFRLKNETGISNEELLKNISECMGGSKVESIENDSILSDGEYITFRTLHKSNDFIDMALRQDICGTIKLFGTVSDMVPDNGEIYFDEEPSVTFTSTENEFPLNLAIN